MLSRCTAWLISASKVFQVSRADRRASTTLLSATPGRNGVEMALADESAGLAGLGCPGSYSLPRVQPEKKLNLISFRVSMRFLRFIEASDMSTVISTCPIGTPAMRRHAIHVNTSKYHSCYMCSLPFCMCLTDLKLSFQGPQPG